MRPCVSVAGTRCTRWPPGLELQLAVDAVADDADHHFLVAADVAGALATDLALPALPLGVAHVHAQQVAGEQRRFVAAGAGADFEEGVAHVVGVARQQQRVCSCRPRALDLGGCRLRGFLDRGPSTRRRGSVLCQLLGHLARFGQLAFAGLVALGQVDDVRSTSACSRVSAR